MFLRFGCFCLVKVNFKMCDEKRKRSPNWLPSEKKLLIDLVEKHFRILENKKTDGVSIRRKHAEWQIITVEYNSHTTYTHRESENLKAQWENMKKVAKKDASSKRMHMMKTGGGPPDVKKEDPLNSRIISLIKTSSVGLNNPFDSDHPVSAGFDDVAGANLKLENMPESACKDLNVVIDQPMIVDQPVENSNITLSAPTVEYEFYSKYWGDYTPQLLRTPVSSQLQAQENVINEENVQFKEKSWMTRRRPAHKVTSSSVEHLHKKKIEAIDFKKKMASQEVEKTNTIHDLEIQIKQEILRQEKIKSRILLLELKIKRKQLKNSS